ncbi:MAG: hypothetical protein Q8M11_11935 [Sulfuritalea sp.]|nr:hypothetical protein [Sulfuritalea sp.]
MTKPPQLEQFTASYDSGQDRLLLRIRSSDDAEYRFWITRRYLALLWPILMKMADDFGARKSTDPLTRNTLAELAHGQAVGNADFSSQYKDGSLFPLGEEPILLARITVKPTTGNTQTLTLLPQQGQGINLDLDERLVHVLARLLQQAAVAAEWGLTLNVTTGSGLAAEPLQPAAPRLLH